MKKMTGFLLTVAVVLAVFIAGCGSPEEPKTEVAPQPPTVPTQSISTPASATQPTFAKACPADLPCAPLEVSVPQANSTYCVQKIPYQNFSLPTRAVIESLDPAGDLKCADSLTVIDDKKSPQDGFHIWTCTGEQLHTYQIQINNPACKTRNLAMNIDKCQADQGYDAAEDCCAIPSTTKESGYAKIDVNIGACPSPPK